MMCITLTIIFFVVGAAVAENPPSENLWDTAKQNGLNKFIELAIQQNLQNLLTESNEHTIFAPVDHAFEVLQPDLQKRLQQEPNLLKEILDYHIVQGRVPKSQFVNDEVLSTIHSKQPIRLNQYVNSEQDQAKFWTVNGVNITETDIEATNGMIHLIDNLLFPVPSGNILETLKTNLSHVAANFYNRILAAGLEHELNQEGPITVFIPSNLEQSSISSSSAPSSSSSSSSPSSQGNDNDDQELLQYIVSGTHYTIGLLPLQQLHSKAGIPLKVERNHIGNYVVNNVRIIEANYPASNGVIHILEGHFN